VVVKYETIYSSLPVQSLVISTIKKPILEAIPVIFNPEASKIEKLKAAVKLWRGLQALSNLPRPTLENTWHPNSHNLIVIRDWVLDCLSVRNKQGIYAGLNSTRLGLIDKLFNLVIIIYDFDPPWRWILDSVKDNAFDMSWKPRGYGDDWSEGYHWWNE